MPLIVILAGPNGAGKSTLAARFVPPGVAFLNADNIAQSLTLAPGQNANIAASRLLLARIDEAVQARARFERYSIVTTTSFETPVDALEALFDNEARLDYLAKVAVFDAMREHKRLGQSVVVWQDGKVVMLAPEDILVDLTDEAD